MIVFRMEHPDSGKGIYQHSNGIEEHYKLRSMIPRHKIDLLCPFEDIGRDAYIDEYCAFISMEQLRALIFPIEYKYLLKLGFHLYVISLSNGIKGTCQVVYTKDNIIHSVQIDEYYDYSTFDIINRMFMLNLF